MLVVWILQYNRGNCGSMAFVLAASCIGGIGVPHLIPT